MIIKNALLKDGFFDIKTENGVISDIGNFDGTDVIDAEGRRVIPGMIDTHLHGYGGIDTSDCRFDEMCRTLALAGTTSWLPTTMTVSLESVYKTVTAPMPSGGAHILGFHMEGPYISKNKKGAQNEKFIITPDINDFRKIPNIKKITVAPEIEGAVDFIKKAGCIVSIGHTECDFDTALKAIEAGATCLTHTFNAMPPMLHRNPGPIGAGFIKEIYAELICDGRHVMKPTALALMKMFGYDRTVLISDTIRSAGMPDGVYDSGGLSVHMNGGVATLADGTLAGGSNSLLKNVATAVGFGVDFYDAVRMATENPAKMLNVNKGKVAVGYDADLLIVNDDITVRNVIIDGKLYR